MAGSVNKVILIGNLGKDPEVKLFEGGGKIVRFPLATTENYTNRNGEKIEHTEWHNVTVSRKGLAEVCEKYLKKGYKIYAEGRLRTRSWQDSEGNTKYSTEVQLDSMTMLTSREEAMKFGSNSPQNSPKSSSDFSTADENEDDLPF